MDCGCILFGGTLIVGVLLAIAGIVELAFGVGTKSVGQFTLALGIVLIVAALGGGLIAAIMDDRKNQP